MRKGVQWEVVELIVDGTISLPAGFPINLLFMVVNKFPLASRFSDHSFKLSAIIMVR